MSCLKRLLYPFVCCRIKGHYLGLNPPQKSTSTTFNSQKPLRFVFIISCKKVELATMLVKSTLLRWTSYQICGLSRFGLVKKAAAEQRVKERPPSSSRHALMKKGLLIKVKGKAVISRSYLYIISLLFLLQYHTYMKTVWKLGNITNLLF